MLLPGELPAPTVYYGIATAQNPEESRSVFIPVAIYQYHPPMLFQFPVAVSVPMPYTALVRK
jgi:hypothetical protein